MASPVPNVVLNNGRKMPILAFGTWKPSPEGVGPAVEVAIDIGYRHFDCALVYGNENLVGKALRAKMEDGTVKRENLFITSKLWNTFHKKESVLPTLKESLKNLGLAYLDLYLIHWPYGYKEGGELFPKDALGKHLYSDADYVDTWKAMEECVRMGLVMSIGLSNFNSEQVKRVLDNCTIKPVTNQVECHPYFNQKKLIEFCKSRGVEITGYGPLGSPERPWAKPDDPNLLSDATIKTLSDSYNKTPAQVLIRYQVQRGVIVIPKSFTKSRIESNIQIWDFEISKKDMDQIDSLDTNNRGFLCEWDNDHPHYPFSIEF